MAWVLLSVGCSGTPTTTSGTDTGTNTPYDGACPASVAPLAATVCVEATGQPPRPTTSTTTHTTTYPTYATGDGAEQSGAGTITEVGGALATVPGSAPFLGYLPCGPEHEHQVRLVDEAANTWTFGWAIEGPVDDASDEPFAVGAAMDFQVISAFFYPTFSQGLVLGDAAGPRFVFAFEGGLDDADIGGVTVVLDSQRACMRGYSSEYTVVFTGVDGGVTELKSGGTGTVAATNGPLAVVVAHATYDGCADYCSTFDWAGWAEVP